MITQSQLREKLRKIEALFSGAGTAASGLRPKRHWHGCGRSSRNWNAVIRRSSCSSPCRTNGRVTCSLRYAAVTDCGLIAMTARDERRSWLARLAGSWMKCCGASSDLDADLQAYLHEATLKVIREEVYADTSEVQEIPEALPAA